jgi:hypothetical protein
MNSTSTSPGNWTRQRRRWPARQARRPGWTGSCGPAAEIRRGARRAVLRGGDCPPAPPNATVRARCRTRRRRPRSVSILQMRAMAAAHGNGWRTDRPDLRQGHVVVSRLARSAERTPRCAFSLASLVTQGNAVKGSSPGLSLGRPVRPARWRSPSLVGRRAPWAAIPCLAKRAVRGRCGSSRRAWACIKIRPRRCLGRRGRDCLSCEEPSITARLAAAMCGFWRVREGQLVSYRSP